MSAQTPSVEERRRALAEANRTIVSLLLAGKIDRTTAEVLERGVAGAYIAGLMNATFERYLGADVMRTLLLPREASRRRVRSPC